MRFVLSVGLAALAVSTSQAAEPCGPDLSGHWSGCWVSDKNGHHGPLNAKFEPTCDGYHVRFSGRFWKVFPFVYGADLKVTGVQGDTVYLSASKPLGPVLGSFTMDATASGCHFEARFASKNDHGRFILDKR